MKYIDGFHLYEREEIKTESQVATIIKYVDLAYKIILNYDDIGKTIKAFYLDYENNPIDYNGEITFEFEGEQQTVQAVNGVAEIPFVVVDSGTYVVRTVNPDIENGEVTINV